MRDYVDARFSVGEFLLPSLVVILALSFLSSVWQPITLAATIAMYVYILAVLFDGYIMWRGFKKVLAERLPNVPPKGLLMYGMNRMIQIRRFRIPAPPQARRHVLSSAEVVADSLTLARRLSSASRLRWCCSTREVEWGLSVRLSRV